MSDRAKSEAKAPPRTRARSSAGKSERTPARASARTSSRKTSSPLWRQKFMNAFLEALQQRPFVGEAVEAGCTATERRIRRREVEEWREEDDAFRQAWDEALEMGWDRAEAAAYTRAVDGVAKPIVDRKNGNTIGNTYEYSDRLLEVLLKSNRAKVYADSKQKDKPDTAPAPAPTLAGVLREIRMRRQASLARLLPAGAEGDASAFGADPPPAPASPPPPFSEHS